LATLTGAQRRTFVVLLGLASSLGAFTVDMMMPSFPTIEKVLHATADQMQLTIMAITIGYAAGLLIAGPASDQYGRRKPLLSFLALHFVATIVLALSTSFELFLSMRFLQGLAASAAGVVALAVVRDLFVGNSMLKFLAPMNAVMAVGPIGAPLLGSQLLSVMGWRQILWVLVGIGILLFVLNFIYLKETLDPANRRESEGARVALNRFKHVLADRRYVGVAIVSIMVSVGLFGYLNQAPFLFGTSWHLTNAQFGFAYAGGSVFAMGGMQIGARLSPRVGTARLLLVTLVIGVVAGIACVWAGNTGQPIGVQLAAIYLWVLCFGLSTPPTQTLLLAGHGEEAGTAASLAGILTNALTAFAAPIYAAVSSTSSLGVGQVVVGAMAIALVGYVFIAQPSKLGKEVQALG
jgi:DHA1 family bicyclomycin/chloramphenicol resistance-like MFS transporter